MKQKNDSFKHTEHQTDKDIIAQFLAKTPDEITANNSIIDEARQQIEDVFLDMVNSEAEEANNPSKDTIYNIVMILSLAVSAGLGAFVGVWLAIVAALVVGVLFIVLKVTVFKKKLYFDAEKISYGGFCGVVHKSITPLADKLNLQAKVIMDKERIIAKQAAKISEYETSLEQEIETKLNSQQQLIAEKECIIAEQAAKISEYETNLEQEIETKLNSQQQLIAEKECIIAEQAAKISEYEILIKNQAESIRQAVESAETTDPPQSTDENVAKSQLELQGDEAFARWLQVFTEYAKQSENNDIRMLYSQLKSDLAKVGIYIYDELVFDFAGNVKLPDKEYFADLRSGDDYQEVVSPVIYTNDKVLIRGKIG